MRISLDVLSQIVLDELRPDHGLTTTELCNRLDLGHGFAWYKVALVVERLANDGAAVLEKPGSRVRRFRRAA